ncbi:MAG TPA: hypothetical protein VGK73_07270 [Polyangiaceae bacterium]
MTARSLGVAGVLGCLLALGVASEASAAGSGRLIEIHVDGDPAATDQVRVVATELLAGISMAPVVVGGGAPAPKYSSPAEPFVRAYFDFRSTPPMLVILDGTTSRELERRSLPEHAELEAAVESATHVLIMVVESMLDEQAASEREAALAAGAETPASAAEPALPEEPAVLAAPSAAAGEPPAAGSEPASKPSGGSGPSFEMGLLGQVAYYGEGRVLPGAGAGADLRLSRARPWLGISSFFAFHSAMTLAFGGASAKLNPMSLSLVPSVHANLEASTRALFGLGAGLTWFSLRAEGPPGVALGQSAGGIDATLVAILGVRVRLSSRLSLTTLGALEYDPAPREFVALEGTERRELAALPSFRPFVSVLAAYSFIGSQRAARAPGDE